MIASKLGYAPEAVRVRCEAFSLEVEKMLNSLIQAVSKRKNAA